MLLCSFLYQSGEVVSPCCAFQSRSVSACVGLQPVLYWFQCWSWLKNGVERTQHKCTRACVSLNISHISPTFCGFVIDCGLVVIVFSLISCVLWSRSRLVPWEIVQPSWNRKRQNLVRELHSRLSKVKTSKICSIRKFRIEWRRWRRSGSSTLCSRSWRNWLVTSRQPSRWWMMWRWMTTSRWGTCRNIFKLASMEMALRLGVRTELMTTPNLRRRTPWADSKWSGIPWLRLRVVELSMTRINSYCNRWQRCANRGRCWGRRWKKVSQLKEKRRCPPERKKGSRTKTSPESWFKMNWQSWGTRSRILKRVVAVPSAARLAQEWDWGLVLSPSHRHSLLVGSQSSEEALDKRRKLCSSKDSRKWKEMNLK